MGLVPLEEEKETPEPPLSTMRGHYKKPTSASQEEGPHQESNLPAPGSRTSPFPEPGENKVPWLNLPSLCYFVIVAGAKTIKYLHYSYTDFCTIHYSDQG